MGTSNLIETCKIRDVLFHSVDDEFYSIGLNQHINKEIKISKNGLTLEQVIPVLTYLVEFIQDDQLKINHGDKISCFSWSVTFVDDGHFFEIFEVYPEKDGFISGLFLTHKLFKEQFDLCHKLNVEPDFPLFDQIILVDPLVRTGLQPNLFRWNKEDPNSGWVAMTSEFKGAEFDQLTIGQFMTSFKHVAPYLALPAGHKVIWDGNNARIGFDVKMTIKEFETESPPQLKKMEDQTFELFEIKCMEDIISNSYNNEFLLENLDQFINNKLTVLPLQLWKNLAPDGTGIWALNSEELCIYKLASKYRNFNANLEWVQPQEVMDNSWKMTTKTHGMETKIRVHIDNQTNKFTHQNENDSVREEIWTIKSSGDFRLYDIFDERNSLVDWQKFLVE